MTPDLVARQQHETVGRTELLRQNSSMACDVRMNRYDATEWTSCRASDMSNLS
jgi:hypothetical protein